MTGEMLGSSNNSKSSEVHTFFENSLSFPSLNLSSGLGAVRLVCSHFAHTCVIPLKAQGELAELPPWGDLLQNTPGSFYGSHLYDPKYLMYYMSLDVCKISQGGVMSGQK